MITCACPHCGKSFTVKDELAGRRARCPGCGNGLAIPAATRDEQPTREEAPVVVARYKEDPDDVWEELLDHLSGLPGYEITAKDRRAGKLTFRDRQTGLLITAVAYEDEAGCALAFAFDERRFNPDDIPAAFARLSRTFKTTREEGFKRMIVAMILVKLDKELSRAGRGCFGLVLLALGALGWLAAVA